MSYKIVRLDTAAVVNHAPIDGGSGFNGSKIDYLTILQVPVGTTFQLHIGQTGEGIPIHLPIPFEMCPPEETGVFFSVPVAGAGIVEILVSFDEGSVSSNNA